MSTTEEIADEEMTYAAGLDFGRWTVMVGGAGWYAGSGTSTQGVYRARANSLHARVLASSLGE